MTQTGWSTPRPTGDASKDALLAKLFNTTTRFDEEDVFNSFVQIPLLDYVRTGAPRVLFVGYGETDNWAHQGRYDLVLDSAHRMDGFVAELWSTMQAMPQYRDSTTFIITADHGRGSGPVEWKEHGVEEKGSENVWIAVLGPDTPPLGERAHVAPVTQAQIAATVAALVGTGLPARRAASGTGDRGCVGGALASRRLPSTVAALLGDRSRDAAASAANGRIASMPIQQAAPTSANSVPITNAAVQRAMAGEVRDDRDADQAADVAAGIEDAGGRHRVRAGDKHGRGPVRPFGELDDPVAQGERDRRRHRDCSNCTVDQQQRSGRRQRHQRQRAEIPSERRIARTDRSRACRRCRRPHAAASGGSIASQPPSRMLKWRSCTR